MIWFEFTSLCQFDVTNRYLWGPQTDQLLADEQVIDRTEVGDVYWA